MCPFLLTLTLSTLNTAAYGILLLASVQTRWTTNILETLIPAYDAPNIRQALLQQMPFIRPNTDDPKPFRDLSTITSIAFAGKGTYRYFGYIDTLKYHDIS